MATKVGNEEYYLLSSLRFLRPLTVDNKIFKSGLGYQFQVELVGSAPGRLLFLVTEGNRTDLTPKVF